jgi:hypothetical protein
MRKLWIRLKEQVSLTPKRILSRIDAIWSAMSLQLKCLLLGLTTILALWFVPRWQVAHTSAISANIENEFRKTLAQIIGGAFALAALYFAWRRVVAGDRTVRITEQGHITDRYTKAIEQLGKSDDGKPNIEIRLGAIYALERIAKDSPRDHWTIMEVLTAYVRQNAPASLNAEPSSSEIEVVRPRIEVVRPRTDIQAILTVLGRREIGLDREKEGQRLDLSNTDLRGANFSNAQLQKANFSNAQLQKAYFYKAQLQKAKLYMAQMQKASLYMAQLQGAQFDLEQIKSVRGWESASYDLEAATHLGLEADRVV